MFQLAHPIHFFQNLLYKVCCRLVKTNKQQNHSFFMLSATDKKRKILGILCFIIITLLLGALLFIEGISQQTKFLVVCSYTFITLIVFFTFYNNQKKHLRSDSQFIETIIDIYVLTIEFLFILIFAMITSNAKSELSKNIFIGLFAGAILLIGTIINKWIKLFFHI